MANYGEFALPNEKWNNSDMANERPAFFTEAPNHVGRSLEDIDLNQYWDREIKEGMGPGPESNVEQYPETEYVGDGTPPDDSLDLNKSDTGYPPNRGAVVGTDEIITLQPDAEFDRYGMTPESRFAAPLGTPFEQRGMDDSKQDEILFGFTVKSPIENVTMSDIDRGDGESSGAKQYDFPKPIDRYIDYDNNNGDIKCTSASFEVDNRLPPEDFEGDISEFIRNDDPYEGTTRDNNLDVSESADITSGADIDLSNNENGIGLNDYSPEQQETGPPVTAENNQQESEPELKTSEPPVETESVPEIEPSTEMPVDDTSDV